MATRTIKSAAGKSTLSVAAVRAAVRSVSPAAARKASVTLRDGRSGSKSKSAAGSALSQRSAGGRSAEKTVRSNAAGAGHGKRK